MIHVYAFAEALRRLPPVDGLDGAPLELLSVEGVTTVFSRRDDAPPEPVRDQALAHGQVVDALMREAAAVLPVRFGEIVPDEGALADSVRARAEVLRYGLTRVRDCVEVGVRVWSGTARVDASTGAEYMQRRRDVERERREILDALHGSIASVARDARIDERPLHGREQLVAAYLVPRARLDALRAVVDSFTAAHRDLTVICTGPWAPFSFAPDEVPE